LANNHPPDTLIDAKLAVDLRNKGLTWRAVGIELARLKHRDRPFHANSVFKAIQRYEDAKNVRRQVTVLP
jgi:hypothetical protein